MMRLFLFISLYLLSANIAVFATENSVEISITGLQDPLLSNVRALLSLEKQKNHPRLSAQSIQQMHQKATTEIEQALAPFGHYQPKINSNLTPPPDDNAGQWQAHYHIDPGPAIPITAIELKLINAEKTDLSVQQLLQYFPLKKGDALEHLRYEQGKKNILSMLQDRGYLEASYLVSEVLVDLAAYQARIQLSINTGPRFRFGQVRFQQTPEAFADEFLQDFLPFKQGDYYTAQDYVKFRNALTNSGYFEQISIERDSESNANHEIDLQVKLKPLKKNKYRIRLGYGTDTQIRTKLDWERRYVNRYGHRMELGIIGVQDKRRLVSSLDYIIPEENLTNDFWSLGLRYEGVDYDFIDAGLKTGGKTRLQSIALVGERHYPRTLFDRWSIEEIVSVEYLIEDYNLIELLFPGSEHIVRDRFQRESEALDPQLKTLVPGLRWHYAKSDDQLFTRHGQQLNFSLKGALEGALSSSSFLQARLRGKYIRSVFGRNRRVIFRTDIAYTEAETIDVFGQAAHDFPQSLQFLTGGDRSVRGYQFESLKSKNNLLYGKHLLVGSLEFEQLFLNEWGGAIFYDKGNAFNTFSDMQLKDSVGIGLRWYSPVGPVRLDIAHPLSDDDGGIRLHINIGPDFNL